MKRNFIVAILILNLIILAFSSCVNQKQIAYFQKGLNQPDTISVATAYIPKIQPGDILSIPVGSLNPAASSFFNPFSTMPTTSDNSGVSAGGSQTPGISLGSLSGGMGSSSLAQSAAPGYLVDAAGTIEFPILGTLKVSGLTTTEAKK